MSTSESELTDDDAAELAPLRQLVGSVYQACWNEFYEWEPKYCSEELKKLGTNAAIESYDSVWADIEEWDTDIGSEENVEKIQIQLGEQLTLHEVKVETVKLHVDFPPVPPYEFCAYISRSINCIPLYEQVNDNNNGEPSRSLWIEWCPFVDPDETFPLAQRNDLLEAAVLEWECQPDIDNDIDIILIETVARLKGLLYDRIDDLRLLPVPILSMEDQIGIVQRWHFREPLDSMPPGWTPLSELPSYKVQTEPGELARNWCPLCVEFECVQHVGVQARLDSITSSGTWPRMIEVDRQCGDDCIFNHADTATIDPSTDAIELLDELLFNSDALEWTTSCEIAKIIAQPCWKVYKLMDAHLDEQQHLFEISNSIQAEERVRRPIRRNIVPNLEDYFPHDPCAHKGPCVDCSCALAKTWCSVACRCSQRCHRRPTGCSCSDSCNTDTCNCWRQNRECEPDRCTKCWASDGNKDCRNAPVQRREWRKTEIRRAQFGWGLFALETIRPGEFIINYTGEIYSMDTALARLIVAEYLQRNYNFGLGKKLDIDAYAAGNESRVINDHRAGESQDDRINCIVKNIWVAGDFHIVIFASRLIRTGDELLLSYGPTYWQEDLSQNTQNRYLEART
ncbi:hypothetical protein M408DRAFT_326202 [Serendipita vermifera MAFF 305830]|uniref:SET domain-containing protein n=1 Tax=Serendipita vermifera MAFF 305830 TaxID=933852 RepID=A0A0C2X5W6_SERVB|nr:hypothetical protein M408DRAFT_326202 [Serendipita vermifera MAFF 305830]